MCVTFRHAHFGLPNIAQLMGKPIERSLCTIYAVKFHITRHARAIALPRSNPGTTCSCLLYGHAPLHPNLGPPPQADAVISRRPYWLQDAINVADCIVAGDSHTLWGHLMSITEGGTLPHMKGRRHVPARLTHELRVKVSLWLQ